MEREIKFASGKYQLSGTLKLNDSVEPVAVMLLIAGSGQVDRNENHKKIRINALKEIARRDMGATSFVWFFTQPYRTQ